MAAPALGAVSEGIRFQLRLFWLHALAMVAGRGVVRVEMERRSADGADDVAVFYDAPGRNDAGALTDVDFFQAKFHRQHEGAIDHAFFTDCNRTNTARPLLARLAATWSAQRLTHPSCRISFVTNWAWIADDPLRPFVREDGHLDPRWLTDGRRAVRAVRDEWARVANLRPEDFRAFIGRLRICAPWATMSVLDERVRDRMELAGFASPSLEKEVLALDGLATKFLESGRTVWDRDTLLAALAREGLARAVAAPRPIVTVRSFRRFAGLDLGPAAVDVDLTDLFDGRRPRAGDWDAVDSRLVDCLTGLAHLDQPFELALDCHLSIAWRMGLLLDAKSGLRILLRQKGLAAGVALWNPTPARMDEEWRVNEIVGTDEDIVVAASITHDVRADVERTLPALGLDGATRVHVSVPELGPTAIRDGQHASALASALVSALRGLPRARPRHVHFFVAGPVSFAFVLGQRAAVLGPATMYEFDFGGTSTYSPGLATRGP